MRKPNDVPYLHRLSVVLPAVIAIAALAFGVVQWAQSQRSSEASATFTDYVDEGFWDSTGQRAGLELIDEHSPWADQAGFNLLAEHPNPRPGGMVDTRKFLKSAVNGSGANWSELVDVTPGDTITVFMYIENHADYELLVDAPDERGIAIGTRALAGVGDWSDGAATIFGLVSALNTKPAWIAASVRVRSETPIRLEPVRGSARQLVGDQTSELPIEALVKMAEPSDSFALAGEGALIGTSVPDGVFTMQPNGVVTVLFELSVVEP